KLPAAKRGSAPNVHCRNPEQRMSQMGQTRTSVHVCGTTASPLEADITELPCDVAEGPTTDSCTAARQDYSITSSAFASSVRGTSRPSALAVLRLMTSSNLVGPWTGSSLGFAPCRMRSTYEAERRCRSTGNTPYDMRPPSVTK